MRLMVQSMRDGESSCVATATTHARALIQLLDDGVSVQQRSAVGVDIQISVDDTIKDNPRAIDDAERMVSTPTAFPRGRSSKLLGVGVENYVGNVSPSSTPVDSEFPDETSVTSLSVGARLRRTRLSTIGALTFVPPQSATSLARQ
eukprot:TRINITY_DN43960_c0_g1_i1.p1 TRINITY_DN43960_c0_g1~~TRINITY_DN43960_c0_g1_i1.p1  ORF type:complete len:146 (-),score=6.57 TRINITY_DN43960_c0_g1_i1:639-1076(-)